MESLERSWVLFWVPPKQGGSLQFIFPTGDAFIAVLEGDLLTAVEQWVKAPQEDTLHGAQQELLLSQEPLGCTCSKSI